MERGTAELIGAFIQGVGWVILPLLLLPLIILIAPKMAFARNLATHLISIIDCLNYGLGEIVKWALPFLVVIIVISVVLLSIFGISVTKLNELPIYLHAAVIMLGSAATLLAGQHVRVDIFHTSMSPNRKALIDLIGLYLLILPTCLTLLWMSQSFVTQSWIAMEGSNEADGVNGVFLIKSLLPLFAITLSAQGLSIGLRAALAVHGYNRPLRPDYVPPLFGHTPSKPAQEPPR
ncbi:TRAP transporter small permease subunit [Robiginitomaculum antarcticum]|uniref:TRAP transporter small permease subunit n=1 Tax=Robiginitomaculum antarcticum TaxID=437507 RepID=UPI00037D9294|nr:TRAP transporter small permease subunit [Robiginitomaculum antarcticum]